MSQSVLHPVQFPGIPEASNTLGDTLTGIHSRSGNSGGGPGGYNTPPGATSTSSGHPGGSNTMMKSSDRYWRP